jgi:DNA-binding transcriptional regulator YdaS (Cro superfamily)
MSTPSDPRLQEAAKSAIEKAGGGAALARECGITRFAVNQWRLVGIPAGRVPQVSRITGMDPAAIRPDLWDAPATPTPTPAQAAA